MERKVYAIFVAGGSGTRMGGDTPKQFLPLGDKSVLQHTIEVFLEAEPDLNVIVVLPKAHFQTWKEMCLVNCFDHKHSLVAGGITRFHSVKNALKKVPDGAIVSIHDGVRPFISPQLIRDMIRKMSTSRALIPVVSVVDTLKSLEEGVEHPDRTKIAAVQTPQMFYSEDIKAAYEQAYDLSFTDDSSVAEKASLKVDTIPGEKLNIKITTKEDLELGRAILLLRNS